MKKNTCEGKKWQEIKPKKNDEAQMEWGIFLYTRWTATSSCFM
jgi:hypothetical protein